MAPFEYLVAFVAVVVGLAIAHALSGLLKLIEQRDSLRPDWIPVVWTIAIFIWTVFFWWFLYTRASMEATEIHVFHLFFVLAYAAAIYLLIGLLYPHKVPANFDMWAHFEANRKWFYSGLLCLAAIELGDTVWAVLNGMVDPPWLHWVVMAVWILGAVGALLTTHRRYHGAFSVVFTTLVTLHVVLNQTLDGFRTLLGRGIPF